MRRQHFETLQPVCPRCLHTDGQSFPVTLDLSAEVMTSAGARVIKSGRLLCPNPACQQEYPIIDGVPLLVPNVREYVQGYQNQLLQRQDLDEQTLSVIGDCLGPDSILNQTRQYLSTYAGDGFGEFDVESNPGRDIASSQCVSLWHQLDAVAVAPSAGHVVEFGCATGRNAMEIAEQRSPDELTLGLDMNYSMVQFAQQLLQQGSASYPARRTGMVYSARQCRLPRPMSECLDFWVCDATAPPFAPETFGFGYGLNLLDSVSDPLAALSAMANLLKQGSTLRLVTPFEWSSQVTEPQRWIGGHSQRSELGGDPVATLLNLIGREELGLSGLSVLTAQDGLSWQTRITERSQMHYQAYGIVLERL